MTKGAQCAELCKAIRQMANSLRGGVDGWDFRSYVLGLLVYRSISESTITYLNSGDEGKDFDYAQLTDEQAERSREKTVKEKGYFILPSQLFANVRQRAKNDANLNETLDGIFHSIESSAVGTTSEDGIKGLFDDLNVNSPKLGNTVREHNEKLVKLLNVIGDLPPGIFNDNAIDVFDDAYEYLMTKYASSAAKSRGEFFTPQEVSELLARITIGDKTHLKRVYTPVVGSGSLLLKFEKILGKEKVNGFYGHAIDLTTYNLARINMFLHTINHKRFDITLDNTLTKPEHWNDEPFDAIVSDLPYSVKSADNDNLLLINDERFSPAGVLAPNSGANLAFIEYILQCLTKNGTAAIVSHPDVLCRDGVERKNWKYLLDNNYVEAIIQLPSDLFLTTSIATCIMVLKKSKKDTDVLFIDASKEYKKFRNKNKLSKNNISRILEMLSNREDVDCLAKLVAHEDVVEKDYDLTVSTYVKKRDTKRMRLYKLQYKEDLKDLLRESFRKKSEKLEILQDEELELSYEDASGVTKRKAHLFVCNRIHNESLPWNDLISHPPTVTTTRRIERTQLAGLLLICSKKQSFVWALTTGGGRYLLRPGSIDSSFGKKLAYRAVYPSRITSLSRIILDSRGRIDSTSMLSGMNLVETGFSGFGEQASKISGTAVVENLTHKTPFQLEGSSSAYIFLGKNPKTLLADLDHIEDLLKIDPVGDFVSLDSVEEIPKNSNLWIDLENKLSERISGLCQKIFDSEPEQFETICESTDLGMSWPKEASALHGNIDEVEVFAGDDYLFSIQQLDEKALPYLLIKYLERSFDQIAITIRDEGGEILGDYNSIRLTDFVEPIRSPEDGYITFSSEWKSGESGASNLKGEGRTLISHLWKSDSWKSLKVNNNSISEAKTVEIQFEEETKIKEITAKAKIPDLISSAIPHLLKDTITLSLSEIRTRIQDYESEDPTPDRLRLRNWIVTELPLTNKSVKGRYFTHNGKWIKVDENYVEHLRVKMEEIKQQSKDLLEKEELEGLNDLCAERQKVKRKEGAKRTFYEYQYNAQFTEDINSASSSESNGKGKRAMLLDGKLIADRKNTDHKFEICDIFIQNDIYMHNKILSGAAAMSHLVAQAADSARFIEFDSHAREDAKKEIESVAGSQNKTALAKKPRVVIFGLIQNTVSTLTLDTLSLLNKATLARAYEELMSHGIKVAVLTIPCTGLPKKG